MGNKSILILYTYINRYAGIPKQYKRKNNTENMDITQLCFKYWLGIGLEYCMKYYYLTVVA